MKLFADFSADAVGWAIIIGAIANAWILVSNRRQSNANAKEIKEQNKGIISQVGELETKVNGTVEKAVTAALVASKIAVTAGEARGKLEGLAERELKGPVQVEVVNPHDNPVPVVDPGALATAQKELSLPGNGEIKK